jgi:ubiquinone/menaquinone biosynthesis C-methylase UbiE
MHNLAHHLLRAGNRNLPGVFSGRRSRFYDVVARRVVRPVYRRIAVDVAAVAPEGASVLDAGTGPGVLLVELAKRRPDLRLTGVDLSADMVTAARRNVVPFGDRVAVEEADVTRLPFPDASFDVIVSSISVHHWDDVAAGAAELARVLRPGGRVHIYDFPFAPLAELEGSVLSGQRTRFRTGVPFLRYVRLVLTA